MFHVGATALHHLLEPEEEMPTLALGVIPERAAQDPCKLEVEDFRHICCGEEDMVTPAAETPPYDSGCLPPPASWRDSKQSIIL